MAEFLWYGVIVLCMCQYIGKTSLVLQARLFHNCKHFMLPSNGLAYKCILLKTNIFKSWFIAISDQRHLPGEPAWRGKHQGNIKLFFFATEAVSKKLMPVRCKFFQVGQMFERKDWGGFVEL